MAKSVDAKLTKLSNEYSANVKKVRELEAAKKKPFATDAEVKRINEEINKLEAERKTIVENTNTLSKAAKNVDEYTDLNKKLAQYESQIAKRIARGESTADLDKIKQETLGKLEKIAPAVEQNFPELKKTEPKSTKTGPMGNVQMTTGTTVAGTTASKAQIAKYTKNIQAQLAKPQNFGKTEYKDLGGGVQRQVVTEAAFNPETYLIEEVSKGDPAKASSVMGFYEAFNKFIGRG